MAKKKETTLIVAIDRDAAIGSSFDDCAWNFYMIHDKGLDIKESLSAAFQEWYATPEGRAYVEGDGTNWGDATYIPDKFLKKHGIYAFDALASTKGKRWKIAISEYDQMETVEHGESLIEETDEDDGDDADEEEEDEEEEDEDKD